MAKAPKKHTLDIFRTLSAIDQHDMGYFEGLSPEEQKGYHSPVVMRWASAKSGQLADWNLLAVNQRANVHHYEIYDHPELQYKLLASVGLGVGGKSQWIAGPKKDSSGAIGEFLRRYWPDINKTEVAIILRHLREGNNLKDFLDGTGLSPDEIKRVTKLFEDQG